MAEIEVLTPPVPKARPRLGKGGRVFTPRATELAELHIREAWLRCFGTMKWTAGPLHVDVQVRVARPMAHFGSGRNVDRLLPSAPRWPAVRPDLDNYGKTVLDALRNVAYADDGQIVRLYLAKMYARDGEVPGWRIGVYPMSMEDTGDGEFRHGPADAGPPPPAGEQRPGGAAR